MTLQDRTEIWNLGKEEPNLYPILENFFGAKFTETAEDVYLPSLEPKSGGSTHRIELSDSLMYWTNFDSLSVKIAWSIISYITFNDMLRETIVAFQSYFFTP